MIGALLLAAAVSAFQPMPASADEPRALSFSCVKPCGDFSCIVPCPETKRARPKAAPPDDPIDEILRHGAPDDRPITCSFTTGHCWPVKRPLVAPPAVEL